MFEWLLYIVEQTGYWGVGLAMIIENIFPPIPSELIMSFAGAAVGRGEMNFWIVLFVGSVGSVIGLLPWYYGARWVGLERVKQFARCHGRLITLPQSDIDYAQEWFEKYGKPAVFLARLAPIVRTIIAIPAGVARMNISIFLLYAFLGAMLYDAIFLGFGYYFGENYEALEVYLNWGTNVIVALMIGYYLYRVITFEDDPIVEGKFMNEDDLRLKLEKEFGLLPTSQFTLLGNGERLGYIQIRHQPSAGEGMPEECASHIYYEINPEHRGQGYGTKILELGLEEAKKIGIERVLLSVSKDNLHSRKIIEKNGGQKVSECQHETGDRILLYHLDT